MTTALIPLVDTTVVATISIVILFLTLIITT